MIEPRLAADRSDPQLAADMTDAALDAVPTPSTDVTEPIEPIEAKLPTEAMLSTDPVLAMDRTLSCEAIDHLEAMASRCHAGWHRRTARASVELDDFVRDLARLHLPRSS